jgi:hypothetical protein
MFGPSLKQLKQAMNRAEAERERPLGHDELSRPMLPLAAYVDERGIKEMWRVVSELNRRERLLYNRFADAHALGDAIMELVAGDHDPRWSALVAALESTAASDPEWLVEMPLANLVPPRPYIDVFADVGIAVAQQSREWSRVRGNPPYSPGEPFRHLGDRIPTGARWRIEHDDTRVDTRRTAALLMVEHGTEGIAIATARTRASYAIAAWTLLARPEHGPWPTLGDWAPQPYMHYEIDHKPMERGVWMQTEPVRGCTVDHYPDPYTLPDEPELLAAPFRALELAGERRCASAVLSAAWSLYLAEREPSDLLGTDRLLFVHAALEALVESKAPDQTRGRRSPWSKRRRRRGPAWGRTLEAHGIWKEVGRFYSPREQREARQVATELRNIAAHSADAATANLGRQPSGRQRDLALAQAATSFPILSAAARQLAQELWRVARDYDFDDEAYDAALKAP